VKVLDFGVAKLTTPETRDPAMVSTALTAFGAVVGTPEYMAPEQARGRDVDARTDLYALGATLYHALSGRVPFTAPSVNALLFAIVEDAPLSLSALRSELDPALVSVIDRAMAKRPGDRYQTAAEFREALRPFVAEPFSGPRRSAPAKSDPKTLPTHPSNPSNVIVARAQSAPPRGRRNSLIPILAAFGGLVLVAGTALALYGRKNGSTTTQTQTQTPASTATSASTSAVAPPIAAPEPSASIVATSAPAPSPSPATTTVASSTASVATKVATTVTEPTSTTSATTSTTSTTSTTKSTKPTGGRVAQIAMMQTYNLYLPDEFKSAINAKGAAINACYAAAEYDPVDHVVTDYVVNVVNSGTVASVGWESQPRAASLDACMIGVLKSISLPPGKIGRMRVMFRARLP